MMRVANIIEEAFVGGPQVRMVSVASALRGQVQTIICMPRDSSGPLRALCEMVGISYRAMPIDEGSALDGSVAQIAWGIHLGYPAW